MRIRSVKAAAIKITIQAKNNAAQWILKDDSLSPLNIHCAASVSLFNLRVVAGKRTDALSEKFQSHADSLRPRNTPLHSSARRTQRTERRTDPSLYSRIYNKLRATQSLVAGEYP